MKQYRHSIAKSTLEKKYRLNESQIEKVYSHKSKIEQQKAAKRFASANKAVRMKEWYKTSLAEYVVTKRMKTVEEFAQTDKFKNLSKKEQRKINKEYIKLTRQAFIIKTNKAQLNQTKKDLIEARKDKIDKLRARLNAGKKVIFKHRSTDDSYDVNGTSQTSIEDFIKNKYPDELEELIQGKKDDKGEWIQEPISFQDAISLLFDEAIRTGDIKELAQGAGYGYIDKNAMEVISPV